MRRVACLIAAVGALAACSLTTSLDGLSTGTAPTADSGADVALDAGSDTTPAPLYPSCRALLAAVPTSKDGIYDLDPDGPGPKPPFKGYCDMTNDGGGWLRIDEGLVVRDRRVGVTEVAQKDAAGGLVLVIYANISGCLAGAPQATDVTFLAPDVAWDRVRYSQKFFGKASCWTIAGGKDVEFPQLHGLVPFDARVDVVADAVRMGGSDGDAFGGKSGLCNDAANNFWNFGTEVRSAKFILRRIAGGDPAGLSSVVDCGLTGPDTTSPLYWEYADIYVR